METRTPHSAGPARPRHAETSRAQKEKPQTMAKKLPCDPTAILEEIANDPEAPATARVAACKALVAIKKAAASKKPETPTDAVTERALRLLKGGKS